MPAYAYAILVAGWLLWLMPFLLAKRNTGPAEKLDRRARWGILLVVIAYSMLWQKQFCARLPIAYMAGCDLHRPLSSGCPSFMDWCGSLGRQWRIDAGLNPDHEVVTSGPYRVVRHPI